MSDFVLDASLALQWFFEDESERNYSLSILKGLTEKRAVVPILWAYEVGNGLLMAQRRRRISLEQLSGFLERLRALPIEIAEQTDEEIFELPALAAEWGLTNYDAAYLALARKLRLPLATTDDGLLNAARAAGLKIMTARPAGGAA